MRAYRGTTGGDHSAGAGVASFGAPGKRTRVEQAADGAAAPPGPVAAVAPTAADPVEVAVTASALRVRSSPSTSSTSNVLGELHRGDRVQATGSDGGWLTTPYAGTVGYLSGKYTKPVTILDAARDWISALFGRGDHAGDEPAEPAIAPAIDPALPAEPEGPGPTAPPAPTPGAPPSGTAKLSDVALVAFLAGLDDPMANAAAHAVASCEAQAAELATDLNAHEETGAGRDTLVASIAQARAQIALLEGAGLDPVSRTYVTATLYRILTACAPYYSQGRNIDVLETKTDTRTCNLTSLAMALEGLGKTANDYAGSRDKLLAVARYTPYAPRVNAKVAGGTASFSKLTALRLPDFLQLAAIAELMTGSSDAEILAAAQSAWSKIVKTFDIHLDLARRFGVAGETKVLEGGLGGALGSIKKSARKDMQEVVDARNAAERSGDSHDQAAYDQQRDAHATALDGDKLEAKIPLEQYRATVLEHVGGELASGAGVFMLMAAHYARVQRVSDDHVIVDDPGRDFRSGQKVLWQEARAMGYFKKRIVLR
jgi:hypothetical protein